jgi:hypothetical protein
MKIKHIVYLILFVFLGIYSYFLFTYKLEERFFPIGIYSATVESFEELSKAGFNSIQTYNKDIEFLGKYVEEAEKNNLKVLVYPGCSIRKGLNLVKIDEVLRKLRGSPAILAWYLVDEPDVSKIPAEAVKEVNGFIKSLDSTHKTALVIGQGKAAKDYVGCTDITMIDWYPIPHLPLVSVAKNVDEVVKRQDCFAEARNDNWRGQVWVVLQAFDWSFYSKKAREKGIGRNPTYEEMRCMTYLSIIHGVKGIFYYTYKSKYYIKDYPEHWENLKKIVGELRELGSVLLKENVNSGIGMRFFADTQNDPPRRASKSDRYKCNNENVHWCVKRYKDKRYLFAANVVDKPVKVEFEGFMKKKAGPPQIRRAGKIVDEFGPYGVHIYEIH